MNIKFNRHFKNTFWVYLSSFLAVPISYAIKVIYARNLSLEDFGVFFGLFGFFAFFTFFRDWGLRGSVIYYVNKYLVEKNYDYVKTLFWFNQFFQLVLSIVIGLLLFLFRYQIFGVFYPDEKNIEVIFNLFIIHWIFISIFEINAVFFTIFQNQKYKGILNLLNSGLILSISFVLIGTATNNYIIPPAAYLSASLLSALISLSAVSYLYKDFVIRPKITFDLNLFRKVIKYSNSMVLVGAASSLFFATDKIIIQYFQGAEQVAIFVAALSVAKLISFFINPFRDVVHPIVANLWHRKEKEKISQLFSFLYSNIALFFLPLAMALAIFADKLIVAIYGSSYLTGHIVTMILITTVFFSIFTNFANITLGSIGQPKILSRITIQTGFLNLVLNIVLIYYWGLVGIALATLISSLFKMVSMIYHLNKHIPLSFDLPLIAKTLAGGIFFLIISYFLEQQIYYMYFQSQTLNILLNGVIIGGVSLLVYFLILFFLRVVSFKKVEEIRLFVLTSNN